MKLSSILASAACLSAMLLSSCGSSGADAMFDNVDLIPVTTTKDGKWSMVNDKGEIVYDSEFKNRPTAAYNGLFNVKESKGFTVYKVGGKSPEAVEGLDGLKDVGYLEDGLMPVTFPGKRIALVNEKGEIKFELNPIKGAEVVRCAPGYVEGLLEIKTEDDKYGFVDKSGEVVIQPIYNYVGTFADGLVVVGKADEEKDSETTYSVIDKKGNEVFKIKDGYDIVSSQFCYGYILGKKDDRYYIFDKKGEEKKLSAKISSIYDINSKYIIYRSEDGDVGVMDFNDEVIIRPKYNSIIFGLGGDFFLAQKDSDSKELIKIGTNGEEAPDRIDYEAVMPFGKFGYFAQEGKTILMLDDKFAKKGKEEFFDINTSWHRGGVYTDFFDIKAVAETMVKMIDGKKVGDLTLGAPASQIFAGQSPSDYSWKSTIPFDDMTKKGFRYEITFSGSFSETIANYDYDYYSYSGSYKWNPSSTLTNVDISMSAESDWGKKGQEALQNALSAAGYKLVKDGKYGDMFATLYKKGNSLVCALSTIEGSSASLLVFDDPEGEGQSHITSLIDNLDGSESKSSDDIDYAVAEDSCVAVVEEAIADSAVAW